MGLFRKIFGEASEPVASKVKWIPLTELSQLEEIATSKKPVGIFKHSTRCYTSKVVKSQFEKRFDCNSELIDMYYLDLIAYRSISNEIASKYDVIHESPQLLIIKNDELIADDSHMGIMNISVESFI